MWCWNVNGVSATLDKGSLQSFISEYSPTVLCLNETKAQEVNIDKKKYFTHIPSSYAQYWNCSTVKKGYSGTAIFTKVKPLKVFFDFGTKHTGEGRSITAIYKDFILVVTYVPNAGEGLKRLNYRIDEWDQEFHEYLRQLEKDHKKPVLLIGDLNVAHTEIDIYDPTGKEKVPGYTPQERESFSTFLRSGFIDSYRELYPDRVQYSFWSMRQNLRPSNRGWRLDYGILSKDFESKYGFKLEDSRIHDNVMGSDHCPVSVTF